MLTLDRPFYDRNSFKMAEKILNCKHNDLNSGVRWLDSLLDRMLMKNPKDRPSIEEVISVFDANERDIATKVINMSNMERINSATNFGNNAKKSTVSSNADSGRPPKRSSSVSKYEKHNFVIQPNANKEEKDQDDSIAQNYQNLNTHASKNTSQTEKPKTTDTAKVRVYSQ